ncbi:MAG: ERCC4 domain-containing protein [Candidatus Helarchaeota archaeon]
MNNKIKIIVDNREPLKIRELMISEDIDIEVKRLDIGDYILSGDLAVERKTGYDFISAIIDNRLFEQLIRLKDTFNNPILILENINGIFENQGMRLSSIYGVMGYIASRLNIPIIPTRNENDTVILLKRLAFREQVKDDSPILARKAPKNMSLNDRCQYLIEGLFQTGPKRASLLLNKFNNPYNVFKTIIKTKLIYSKTGKIKGIEGPLKDIKGIGVKFVVENKKLLKNTLDI